jgi:DNA repair protein RadA/Sms
MEKQLGMHLMGHDIFMNVAGGVKIMEPAVDMGIVSAIASSFLDRPIRKDTMVVGEVGLAGEVRAVGNVDIRISEAQKMGFTRIVAPAGSLKRMKRPTGISLEGVDTVGAAVELLF